MRACNLVLAYAKDRYYEDAKQVMDLILKSSLPNCPSRSSKPAPPRIQPSALRLVKGSFRSQVAMITLHTGMV